jgi:hypothetical protein
MFDLTTIQLRNVRERAQADIRNAIGRNDFYVGTPSVINALKIAAKQCDQTPVEVLDYWSKR